MMDSNPETTVLRSLVECTAGLSPYFTVKSFMILYFLSCLILSSRFDDISSHLREVISRINADITGRPWVLPEEKPQCGHNLEEIRVLYEHLAEAVRRLNRSFGARLAIYIVLYFVHLGINFYQFNYDYGAGLISVAIFFLYYLLDIAALGAVTERTTNSASTIFIIATVLCVKTTLTQWCMEPGGSMPHSQGLSKNSYPVPKQST